MLRHLVPRTHWDYLSWYRDTFGLWRALAAYPTFLLRGGQPVCITSGDGDRVWLRPETKDLAVYDEVFRHGEYGMPVPTAQYIIDAGAHIGCTSVWFAGRYPGARILSIEPETGNYEMLLRHAREHPKITPIHAGVWSHSGLLQIANPAADTWSFQVCAAESSAQDCIPAVSIDQLLVDHNFPRIDILKIDVEGAEVEVFSTADRWIDRVGMLIVELHDRSRPGCTEAFERALGQRNVTITRSAESHFVRFLNAD